MKKNVAFILIVFILLLALFLRSKYQEIRLESELSDISIPNLTVDNKAYSIKDGKVKGTIDAETKLKVLRLAAFYQWNKEDPLFWAPGFNYKAIGEQISPINKEHKDFLRLIGVQKSTYPADFLDSMVKAASDESSFMNNPSDKMADNLIRNELKASRDYIKDSKELSSILKDKLSLITFAVRVREEIFKSDADKITDNGYALQKEILARQSCLLGKGNCTRPEVSFRKPTVSGSGTSNGLKVLPKSLIYPKDNPSSIHGPYAVKSFCYGWGDDFSYPTNLFYVKYSEDGNIKTADVQLATDIYFKKIYPDTLDKDEIRLMNEGSDHIWTSSTSPYRCPYQKALAEVVTLDNFITNNKPIFGDKSLDSEDKFFSEARRVESNFYNSKYPSYQDAANLAKYYAYAYKLMGNSASKKEIKDNLLERYLAIDRKMLGIDSVFNYVNYFVKSPIESNEVSPKNGSLTTLKILYKYRTYYGLFYLPFSSSIWRSQDSLSYADKVNVNGATGFDKLYLLYSEAVKKYDGNTIRSWLSVRR